jgi:hypothetical protein
MMFEQHSLFDTRWLADRPRDYGSPLVTLWLRRLRVLCAGNSDVAFARTQTCYLIFRCLDAERREHRLCAPDRYCERTGRAKAYPTLGDLRDNQIRLIRNHAVARQRGTGPLSCLDADSGGCCALRNVCKRMRSRSNRFLMISFAAVKAPVFPIPCVAAASS